MLIHFIADFGAADLAFAEVVQRLRLLVPGADVHCTTVPPFATLAAGFSAAQLALGDAPEDMVVFHNVAPRRDDRAGRPDNAGEKLACLTLPSGVRVIGPNAGHTFSFLAAHATDFREMLADNAGTQFRSRDNYPPAIARLLNGDATVLGARLSAADVPALPESAVAYVDGFGNIKTTITAERQFTLGSRLDVTIGGHTRQATVAGAGFALPEGELALSVGSSGWRLPDGGSVRFRELFLRGGSAWEAFGRPAPAVEIQIRELPV